MLKKKKMTKKTGDSYCGLMPVTEHKETQALSGVSRWGLVVRQEGRQLGKEDNAVLSPSTPHRALCLLNDSHTPHGSCRERARNAPFIAWRERERYFN